MLGLQTCVTMTRWFSTFIYLSFIFYVGACKRGDQELFCPLNSGPQVWQQVPLPTEPSNHTHPGWNELVHFQLNWLALGP